MEECAKPATSCHLKYNLPSGEAFDADVNIQVSKWHFQRHIEAEFHNHANVDGDTSTWPAVNINER